MNAVTTHGHTPIKELTAIAFILAKSAANEKKECN